MPVCPIYFLVYKPFIKKHNDLTHPPSFPFGEWVLLSVTTLFCSLKKQRKTKRPHYTHIYNVIWTLHKPPCVFPEFHELERAGGLGKGAPWVMYTSHSGGPNIGGLKKVRTQLRSQTIRENVSQGRKCPQFCM